MSRLAARDYIEQVCASALAKSKGKGVWRDNFPSMTKKLPISRLVKYLPRSVEKSTDKFYDGMEHDRATEAGEELAPIVSVETIPEGDLDRPLVEGPIDVLPPEDEPLGDDALPLSLAVFHKGDKIEIFGDDISSAAVRSTLKNKSDGIGAKPSHSTKDGAVDDVYWIAENTEKNIATLKAACGKAGVSFIESKAPRAPKIKFYQEEQCTKITHRKHV